MTIPTKAIEAAAKVIWNRMAPEHIIKWEDETHKAEYIDCAQAALAAALPHLSGWRDISTAPRDGTLVILTTGSSTGTARWAIIASVDTLQDIDGCAVFRHEYGWRSASDKAITKQPTHWMPLPPPPAEPDGERG